MNSKLPQKYEENFFRKILLKIKNFLFKNKNSKVKSNDITATEKHDKISFKNEIKVNRKLENDYKKKKLMETLNNNPDLLENFSDEKLEKILQMYLEENEKKRATLKNMTS